MKKIVIIGGGVAGLSAGIFAQKNGFESIILEKNPVLGGECTGWDRLGYHIDGCIHWLVGTEEGTGLNELWKTVGALDGVEIYNPETFLSFEFEGETVHLYRDLERLKSSWLQISPDDKETIEDFYKTIKRLHSFEVPTKKPMDLMNPLEKIRLMLSMKEAGAVIQKYGRVSLKEYAHRFKHPALRETLANFVPENYSVFSIFFALANFTRGQASVPRGGSKAFALRMVERYKNLGGVIKSPREAVELEIDNKQVKHVICSNGESFEADYVVAACDAKVLFERLLKNKYNDPAYENRFNNPEDYPLASQVLVALGYEGLVEDLPRTLSFQVDPFNIGTDTVKRLQMTNFGYEPDFSPKGHSILTFAINQYHDDYEFWNKLKKDNGTYRTEKERIGKDVLKATEQRFPEMKGKLKVIDVATPKTYERYCNAYRGAFMGFMPTVRGKMMEHPGYIKGLDNIFLSGQWLQPPGGLPNAVITGKDTIMRICKKEKQQFINS
ncbi:MAG: NAD(P)/FAD-dependent oxidoreductase [Bacillota bacterium]|nr:NAD(P)/FAD-dependent oxidoreductase [Bacillota bacterium]